MDELVRWLTACLDEDAARATAAADGGSGEWFMGRKWNVYRAEDETPDEDGETNELVAYGNVKDQSEHIAEHDPARVLREIDSKRRLIKLIFLYEAKIDGEWGCCHDADQIEAGLCEEIQPDDVEALRLLALPYSDRPGYRAEWAPTA